MYKSVNVHHCPGILSPPFLLFAFFWSAVSANSVSLASTHSFEQGFYIIVHR